MLSRPGTPPAADADREGQQHREQRDEADKRSTFGAAHRITVPETTRSSSLPASTIAPRSLRIGGQT